MKEFPKILSSAITVRFQDCDPYNHLNHAKYLDYFMNAREDQVLEAYDLDIYNVAVTQGVGWVTAQNQIAYIRPVQVKEKVEITSAIIQFAARAMSVEFQMINAESKQLKAVMWSTFVHIDMRTAKSIPHNEYFMEMFPKLVVPLETADFETRVKMVRAKAMEQNPN